MDPNVDDGAMPVNVSIERVVTHERYNDNGKIVNDIALLKLKHAVTFNSKCFRWETSVLIRYVVYIYIYVTVDVINPVCINNYP